VGSVEQEEKMTANGPLVSVVTPVYNGGAFFAECVESVLAQTYSNWEYIIVNNCSTDGTLELAEKYARKDKRIRLYNNDEFLGIIPNHNKAFRLICAESKYCKDVSADDWIFPEFLERMVALAEAAPTVGIVGSYQLSGGGSNWQAWRVRWGEVPYPRKVIPGREVCRSQLLGGPFVFGSPTATLYRADLVRGAESFYPNSTVHADTSACYKYLRNSDFGFVHQVLSYERIHETQVSANSREVDTYRSSLLGDLLEYGRFYLTEDELTGRLEELVSDYYRFLAANALGNTDKAFWKYHRERLRELGLPISTSKLGAAIFTKCLDLAFNPKSTIEKALKRFRHG